MSGVLNQSALSANRQGRLTLIQAIGLVPMILLGGIFLLMAAGISGWFLYSLITQTFKGSSVLAGVIFVFPISLFLTYLAFLIGGKRLIDMFLGKVSQVEGRGIKFQGTSSRNRGVGNLYYAVGEEKFIIQFYGSWKALEGGARMRAYYTPLSKVLMNLEPIYSQSSTLQSAGGNLKRDEELEGLQRLDQAEIEAKKQKKD